MTLSTIYRILPTTLQDVAISLYGANLKRIRYGEGFKNYLSFLEDALSWSREKLENYQFERLQIVLTYAYETVPFYRTKFQEIGLVPSDITSLSHIKNLPVIEKNDIRTHFGELVSTKHVGRVVKLKTSGSTGTPLTVLRTKESIMHQFANNWRQFRWLGIDFRDRLASFNGRLIVPSAKDTKRPFRRNNGGNQTLFSVYHLDDVHMKYMVEELQRGEYRYVVGYPSALSTIANYMINHDQVLSGLKGVFTSSETLYPEMRKAIESAFSTVVLDEWGAAELTASFLQYPDGYYYQNAEDSIVEVFPNTDGTYRLIVTDLTNLAMPLIRYDIGDTVEVARRHEDDRPSFDRLTVRSIVGREDDILVTADGRRHGRLSLVKGIAGISKSQIVQLSLNEIVFNIVATDEFDQAQQSRLLRNAREKLGDMSFRVEIVHDIPHEQNGKFKGVINCLQKNRLH